MRAGRGDVPGTGGLRAPPPPLLLLLLALLPAAAPRSPALAAAPAGPSVSLYLSEDEVRRLLGEWRRSRGLVSPAVLPPARARSLARSRRSLSARVTLGRGAPEPRSRRFGPGWPSLSLLWVAQRPRCCARALWLASGGKVSRAPRVCGILHTLGPTGPAALRLVLGVVECALGLRFQATRLLCRPRSEKLALGRSLVAFTWLAPLCGSPFGK